MPNRQSSPAASSLRPAPAKRRVLGIDPGYAITGFGFLEEDGGRIISAQWGTIRTSATADSGQRLLVVTARIKELLKTLSPTETAVEEIFFAKNVKTALRVAEARGAIIAVLAEYRLPVFNYTPLVIKQTVTGYGQASKVQVQKLLVHLLNLTQRPRPDDAADALAAAYTHIMMTRT